MSGKMRALTVQEPWASAIIYGPKDVENRPWATAHRGTLWIHAGKRVDWSASKDAWLAAGLPPPPSGRRFDRSAWTASLPLGKVIGSVDLTGCHDDNDCYGPLQRPCNGQHPLCSKWAARFRQHWKMTGKRPLPEPVPCRGSLGLWKLPEDVAAKVQEQLAGAP